MGADEEAGLLRPIAALPFKPAPYKAYFAKRRMVMFEAPIPAFLQGLAAAVARRFRVEAPFVHALVNEYQAGTPLGWHRDAPEYGRVCGVSLAAPARMRFRPFPPGGGRRETLSIDLAPRSAYLLSEDARWRWQHSIVATAALRYSVTFRTAA